MIALDYALAIILLVTPTDQIDLSGVSERFATVRPTLAALAVDWEILDPRELRYVLIRCDDFSGDLKLLHRRYAELNDAPPLQDQIRFPDRLLINDYLAFNRSYRQTVDSRLTLEPSRSVEFNELLQEVDSLYMIWDTIRDVRCDYYYVTVRRQSLKKVRDILGFQAYYNGNYPPSVPLWRFARGN